MRTKRGSNQYQRKYRVQQIRSAIFMILLIACLVFIIKERIDNRIISVVIEAREVPPITATPTPTNTPTPTPTISELENVISYITRTFEPQGKKVVKEALDVAFCESGWRKEAYNFNTNGTGDYNLFQINSIHMTKRGYKWLYNWQANVDTAYQIYKEQGWSPWVCSRKLGIIK